jgi:hypothetical protein
MEAVRALGADEVLDYHAKPLEESSTNVDVMLT